MLIANSKTKTHIDARNYNPKLEGSDVLFP